MDNNFQARIDEMLKKVHLEPQEEPEPKVVAIEISFAWSDDEGEFFHHGYYNTTEEAIKALKNPEYLIK